MGKYTKEFFKHHGRIGGQTRSKRLSARRRRAIAVRAITIRWARAKAQQEAKF